MGRMVTLKCNCGCGVQTEKEVEQATWLELEQIKGVGIHILDSAPKLDGHLYFSSLECLYRWTVVALAELPCMQETARGLEPRGSICSDKALGLYI